MKRKISRATVRATERTQGPTPKWWEADREALLFGLSLTEAGIERAFRYIEMVAIIALLLVAVGDSNQLLSGAISVAGSWSVGYYATMPVTRFVINRGYRRRWGQRRWATYLLAAFWSGPAAGMAWLAAIKLAHMIEVALRSN